MKKILALTLALTLLLCGCGGANAAAPETTAAAPTVEQTQAPTTEPTTVPTTEPEVYRNPLNGEVLGRTVHRSDFCQYRQQYAGQSAPCGRDSGGYPDRDLCKQEQHYSLPGPVQQY